MLGSSHPEYDHNLISIIRKIKPKTILDLGCGKGKLGNIIKASNTRTFLPDPLHLIGVNPLFDKSADLQLLASQGYDEILDLTIDQYCTEFVDKDVDVITALDVLEHLPRSKAFDVIDQLLYHCKFLIIIWPIAHPQYASGNLFDAHRSSFKPRDLFQAFEVSTYLQTGFSQLYAHHTYNFCVLRGHMNIEMSEPLF